MQTNLSLLTLLFLTLPLSAQWEPGSVYREYTWMMPEGGEAFLRVGGRYGYRSQVKLPPELQQGDQLILPEAIDLEGAIRAEVSLEKVQSHEDSRDLTISINDHAPIPVPEPAWIPEPQTEYMYHTELTVPIPLEQLTDVAPIRFSMALDTAQRWGWPQNVFYGLTFRIYYAPDLRLGSLPQPTWPTLAKLPVQIPAKTYISLGEAAGAMQGVKAVDYIFVGKDIDWSGRGVQQRKHWQTHRGKPHHILGHSTDADHNFAVAWDTEWLPEQESFGVQARVLGEDGKYRVSEVQDGLTLAPRPYNVYVYESGPAPRNWVTRSGEFEQTIRIDGAMVDEASALQLSWLSWSPCYSNGVYLNGHLIWDRTEDCYVVGMHEPVYEGLEVKYLQEGENVISTSLTPLFQGQMVHGMEVQWPGIQLKVKYGGGVGTH